MARTKLAPYQLSLNLENVDNVAVESIELNELLKWDGTKWVNKALISEEVDAGENTIGFTERVNTSSSGSATIDWTKSNHQVITLTENTTLTFTAPSKPCNLTLRIKQDTTGGWTVTLPTVKTSGGYNLSFTTTAEAEDLLMLYFDGSSYIASVLQDIK